MCVPHHSWLCIILLHIVSSATSITFRIATNHRASHCCLGSLNVAADFQRSPIVAGCISLPHGKQTHTRTDYHRLRSACINTPHHSLVLVSCTRPRGLNIHADNAQQHQHTSVLRHSFGRLNLIECESARAWRTFASLSINIHKHHVCDAITHTNTRTLGRRLKSTTVACTESPPESICHKFSMEMDVNLPRARSIAWSLSMDGAGAVLFHKVSLRLRSRSLAWSSFEL